MLKFVVGINETVKELFFYLSNWILFLSLHSSSKTVSGVKWSCDSQRFHVYAATSFYLTW